MFRVSASQLQCSEAELLCTYMHAYTYREIQWVLIVKSVVRVLPILFNLQYWHLLVSFFGCWHGTSLGIMQLLIEYIVVNECSCFPGVEGTDDITVLGKPQNVY